MACFHPWIHRTGKEQRILPCGQCIGCRVVKQRAWATRCMHEAQMHEKNCFITLTYDEEHITPSLNYHHFQNFIRNLRLAIAPDKLRFFMAGEYGETTQRPHYHALLFGLRPTPDYQVGKALYGNKAIDAIWGRGFASFGDITYASASYCASYTTKKITGKDAKQHYQRVDPKTGEIIHLTPEFAKMSLKPGIGHAWWLKYGKETYLGRDGIVRPGGHTIPTPRYYDVLLERYQPEQLKRIKEQRFHRSAEFLEDMKAHRMAAREKCAEAKRKFLKREKI